jgi:hypothetical protein
MNILPLKLSVTTCYLIKAGEQYVLIDTGYEEDWDLYIKVFGLLVTKHE